jgi:outer membrane protein OmpA-like peptidoglycan-associated protein
MHRVPKGAVALSVALATWLLFPAHALAVVPIIECNEMTVGQPCDTDDTVCTIERCVRIGASVECQRTGNAAGGTACESDAEPCTIDACAGALCKHNPLPEGTVCFDGLFCTDGETCSAAGVCGGGAPTCDDHNMCSTDICDEDANTCSHGPAVVCPADGNPCTSDACSPTQGCNHAPEPATTACDDGLFCSTADHCDGAGSCTGRLNCLDTNACTVDSCDEDADLCHHTADVGAACDDANACTGNDACTGAALCAGADLPDLTPCSAGGGCLMGGVCTAGVCGAALPVLDGTPCSDADACTDAQTCLDGVCQGGGARTCDDGDDCTLDGCDPGQGCVAAPIDQCMPTPDGGVPDTDGGPNDTDGGPNDTDGGPNDTDGGPNDTDGGPNDTDGGPNDTDGGPNDTDGGPNDHDGGPNDTDGGPNDHDGGPNGDGGTGFHIDGDLGGGGCGCEVGGRTRPAPRSAVALAAFALLATFVTLRRRRRRAGAALVLLAASAAAFAALAAPRAAHAEGFDAELFKPTTSTTGFISQDGDGVLPAGALQMKLTLDVASDLLVLRDPDTGEPLMVTDPNTGEVISADGRVLGRRTGVSLGAGYGIGDWLELSASLPMAVAQTGNLVLLNRTDDLPQTALGDLRLGAKARLFGERSFGVAGSLTLVVPTGDDAAFSGAGTVIAIPRLVAGVHTGRTAFAVNLGYALRQPGGAGNLEVDDEVMVGAGARFDLVPGMLWALADGYTRIGVQGSGSEREMPAELMGTLRWRVNGPWMVEGGGGVGLTHGYGAPKLRVLVSIAYAPTPMVRPLPRPITEVVMEEAPPVPEPPPPDRDNDGIPDAKDACPDEPEDLNGVKDDDGCPDADQDGDGILDKDDKCPTEKEVVNGVDDLDGCPDEGLFELKEDRIVLEERVLFDTERARVKTKGKRVLKAVVVLWEQHPDYEKMIIEGHTDARGTDSYNMKLGQRRAEAVRDELVAQGFPADKIEIVSYGRSRPVDTSKTEAAWQKNRRTEFVIVRKTKTPVPAPVPAAPAPATPATPATPAAAPDAPPPSPTPAPAPDAPQH